MLSSEVLADFGKVSVGHTGRGKSQAPPCDFCECRQHTPQLQASAAQPLKLRPYGGIEICVLLLLLLDAKWAITGMCLMGTGWGRRAMNT